MSPWSDEEKAILRKVWASPIPVRLQLDQLPGRSEHSIVNKARLLKLGKKPRDYSPSWVRIDALMRDGIGRTIKEIHLLFGMSSEQVRTLFHAAVERGEYHYPRITRAGTNGRQQKVFVRGPGRNANPLRKLTADERQERCLSKIDPAELEVRRARYYTRRLIKTKKIVRRDPLVAALFGNREAA